MLILKFKHGWVVSGCRSWEQHLSANKVLAEAVAFAIGTGLSDPEDLAGLIDEHLRKVGYSLRSDVPPTLDDMEAATLRKARVDLGLTHQQLAFHAGVKTSSVAKLEAGQALAEAATAQRIRDALARLGARRAE